MSPEIIGLIGIVLLLVLLYARMWIGLAMFFVGFWGIVAIQGWEPGLWVLGTVPYRQIGNYVFTAMPLFILMGVVVYNAGFASDIFHTAHKWIGQYRGGLAMATSMAGAFLGVITDSMIADITLGKVAVPEMRKYRYDDAFANASVLAGASLASVVPPSVGFIVYGLLVGESIGKLYIAGIIPAILLVVLLVVIIYLFARVKPAMAPAGPATSFKEKLISLKFTWSVGILFLLILVGIYGGIFTPTEGGAVGACGSILIGIISRRLKLKTLLSSVIETVQMTAMIVLMMAGAFVFMNLMAVSELPFSLAEFVVDLNMSPYLVMAVIILVHIIIGMFSDIIAAILLTIPILYPVVTALGFDPIWYGVVMVILIEIGFITPPIGMNVFVLSGITKTPVNTIFKGIWPFVVAELMCIALLIFFPEIVLFLPGTMN